MRWRKILLWILAAVITLGASVYQRKTGPTYPLDLETTVDGTEYQFELTRSATIEDGCEVKIPFSEKLDSVKLVYHKYPGNFQADTLSMKADSAYFRANLPVQPAAGKLQYYVMLYIGGERIFDNADDTAIVRFKGSVPAWALIPHVLAMFIAMFLSTLALLMAITKTGNFRRISWWAVGALVLGGFVFGPIVQYFAFGQAWTGFPVGMDLTDNKTLIAGLFWIAAILLNLRKERRWAVIIAAIVLLGIFSIPHSARGSEFDYENEEVKTG
jgi:hypothetical protein